mmetsp:Transcript_145294/g.464222  ORF Transcript_145294/g.464222 Transcript_145294/m.464222 type:complete len:240 (-) Transcript_145294:452-1171(-)
MNFKLIIDIAALSFKSHCTAMNFKLIIEIAALSFKSHCTHILVVVFGINVVVFVDVTLAGVVVCVSLIMYCRFFVVVVGGVTVVRVVTTVILRNFKLSIVVVRFAVVVFGVFVESLVVKILNHRRGQIPARAETRKSRQMLMLIVVTIKVSVPIVSVFVDVVVGFVMVFVADIAEDVVLGRVAVIDMHKHRGGQIPTRADKRTSRRMLILIVVTVKATIQIDTTSVIKTTTPELMNCWH